MCVAYYQNSNGIKEVEQCIPMEWKVIQLNYIVKIALLMAIVLYIGMEFKSK